MNKDKFWHGGHLPVTDSWLGAVSGTPQFICVGIDTVGELTEGGGGVAIGGGGSGGKSWPAEERQIWVNY